MATTNAQTFTIGGVTHQVEDVGARQLIADLQTALNAITSGDTTTAIKTFNEIIAFLDNIEDTSTLQGIIAGLNTSIAGKVDKVTGKGLSTNDFTDAEKTKLAGIAAGAQVNVINGIKAHGASTNLPVTNGVVELPEQTEVDMDDYYDKDEVDARIANKLSDVIVNNIPAGSVAIIDDTTTGGRANAWSAEQGKLMANRSNLAAQRIALLRQLLEHAVFDGDVTDIFDALEALDAAVESITLNQSSLTFSGSTTPGATQTLVATTDPVGANVSWSSSDTSVATVNGGVVTAVGNGTCVITASAGGLTATCNVSVSGILAVYEISLGTLSHVSVTDGNGDAISDGDEITEGSTLTIVLTPDASHVIDTASVTMGGVAQTLTDGQDGEKTLTIASVSGDIAISASATYVVKDYAADPSVIQLTGHGVSNGSVITDDKYNCMIVPIDFGKVYHITDYDWFARGGTGSGYNMALVTDDGNGGYATLQIGTDFSKPTGMDDDFIQSRSSGAVRFTSGSVNDYQKKDNVFINVLPKSAYTYNEASIEHIYLAVGTYFNGGSAPTVIPKVKEMFDGFDAEPFCIESGLFRYKTYPAGMKIRFIPIDFGKSYSYSGYDTTGGTSGGYTIGLAAVVGGVINILSKSDVTSPDTFFSNSTRMLSASNPPASGSFSTPAKADISVNADRLYIIAQIKWSSDTVDMSNFVITENS